MPVTWENPPASRWQDAADQLRRHPNTWARIDDVSPASVRANAHHIRNGTLAAFRPAGTFRAMARGDELWACYVQPGDGREGPPTP